MWPVITGGLLVILATILHHAKVLNDSLGEGFQINVTNYKTTTAYKIGDLMINGSVIHILTNVPGATIGSRNQIGDTLAYWVPVFTPPYTVYVIGNSVYYKDAVYTLITAPAGGYTPTSETPLTRSSVAVWAAYYNSTAKYMSGQLVINNGTINAISITNGVTSLVPMPGSIPAKVKVTSPVKPTGITNVYAKVSDSLNLAPAPAAAPAAPAAPVAAPTATAPTATAAQQAADLAAAKAAQEAAQEAATAAATAYNAAQTLAAKQELAKQEAAKIAAAQQAADLAAAKAAQEAATAAAAKAAQEAATAAAAKAAQEAATAAAQQAADLAAMQAPTGTPLYPSIGRDLETWNFPGSKQISLRLYPDGGVKPPTFINPLASCPGSGTNCGTITWPTNTSAPAKITGMFVEDYGDLIFITLDKVVDPNSTVFYLSKAQGFQNMGRMAPASIIQGFQSGNPYNSSPANAQALEFRLGQTAMNRQVQNGWLM